MSKIRIFARILVGGVILISLFVLLGQVLGITLARAQVEFPRWTSSADPPAGTALEDLSPPDERAINPAYEERLPSGSKHSIPTGSGGSSAPEDSPLLTPINPENQRFVNERLSERAASAPANPGSVGPVSSPER